jgi:Putative Actinobacterial Holin-X, holin superfamily III
MATDLKSTHEPSVTELVTGIINDAQALFKQQFEMLKHEVREDLRKAREGSLMLAVGGGVGLLGAFLLTQMLALFTHWAVPSLPDWACYGIWGVVMAIISAALFYTGKSKLDSVKPLDETAQTVKENVQWIGKPK